MNFTVSVQPSGRVFDVETGEAVLSAAIRQGVGLPYGCKDGACGSCRCRLVAGRVVHTAHQPRALSEADEAAGYVLTCCAHAQTDIVLEARTVAGADEFPIRRMPTRVTRMTRPSHDVVILTMQLPANDTLRYHAGQYVEFILPDGDRRSYSMASSPNVPPADGKPQMELHIRHLPGGKFTDRVFTTLKEKDILRIEGPFGSFYLRDDSDKPMLLLASGTGLAPLKAIVEDMEARHIERPAVLYWGCRSRADLYLHDWALAAAARLPWLRYVPVLSDPLLSDAWTGRTGFVHHAVIADLPDLSAHQVYACGAPAMVDAAQRDFISICSLPADEFLADAFTSAADKLQA